MPYKDMDEREKLEFQRTMVGAFQRLVGQKTKVVKIKNQQDLRELPVLKEIKRIARTFNIKSINSVMIYLGPVTINKPVSKKGAEVQIVLCMERDDYKISNINIQLGDNSSADYPAVEI